MATKIYVADTAGKADVLLLSQNYAGTSAFIDGKDLIDTLDITSGPSSSKYTLLQNPDGTIELDSISAASGSHFTLYNMEIIKFPDKTVDLRTYFANAIETSENLSAYLDYLHTPANLSKITNITLVSPLSVVSAAGKLTSATPTAVIAPLTVNASQVSTDADVLAKVISAYSLDITDTSANIVTYLSTLNNNVAHIHNITLTDSNPVLNIPAATVTADAALLAKIVTSFTYANTPPPATYTMTANTPYTAFANQTITGTAGIDKVIITEPSTNFTVTINGSTTTLLDTVGTLGTETLNFVERVAFNDKTLALDFQSGQSGYVTALMIGTAFAASKVPTYFAPGIAIYDQGQTNAQVATLIESLNLIENQIGSTTNSAWVDFVYTNVIGASNPAGEAQYITGLNNGTYTKAQLLGLAAELADSGTGTLATQIGLVAYQTHGLFY